MSWPWRVLWLAVAVVMAVALARYVQADDVVRSCGKDGTACRVVPENVCTDPPPPRYEQMCEEFERDPW